MFLSEETHRVSVYRLTRTGNKDAYSGSPIYENIDIWAYPAGTDILAVYPGESSFALHDIHIEEPCTLQNGDKLVATTGEEYIVRGVPQVFNSMLVSYQRLVGEKVV